MSRRRSSKKVCLYGPPKKNGACPRKSGAKRSSNASRASKSRRRKYCANGVRPDGKCYQTRVQGRPGMIPSVPRVIRRSGGGRKKKDVPEYPYQPISPGSPRSVKTVDLTHLTGKKLSDLNSLEDVTFNSAYLSGSPIVEADQVRRAFVNAPRAVEAPRDRSASANPFEDSGNPFGSASSAGTNPFDTPPLSRPSPPNGARNPFGDAPLRRGSASRLVRDLGGDPWASSNRQSQRSASTASSSAYYSPLPYDNN